ncbi:MAG: hypothetical protein E4H02_01000 [Lentisphaerales bacterium]|nr:MAG: hypothetical protein E4H02_01000 [Lentisphaerales bacterium]
MSRGSREYLPACIAVALVLQEIRASLGYIPRDAVGAVARFLNLHETTVYGVVTFYSQFYLTRQGKHKIKVCQELLVMCGVARRLSKL